MSSLTRLRHVTVTARSGGLSPVLSRCVEALIRPFDVSGQRCSELRSRVRVPVQRFELSRIFKFYYTDPQGSPDLSLAAARLITETYGGELNATQESDKVAIQLSLPLGDR